MGSSRINEVLLVLYIFMPEAVSSILLLYTTWYVSLHSMFFQADADRAK